MLGLEGTPLVYIIALVKPAGWTILDAVNDLEQLIYSVALVGIVLKKTIPKFERLSKERQWTPRPMNGSVSMTCKKTDEDQSKP